MCHLFIIYICSQSLFSPTLHLVLVDSHVTYLYMYEKLLRSRNCFGLNVIFLYFLQAVCFLKQFLGLYPVYWALEKGQNLMSIGISRSMSAGWLCNGRFTKSLQMVIVFNADQSTNSDQLAFLKKEN